ncbi:MAG: DNA polymerase III subunit delta [Clostridia bacterium]|nr:DNA polymerase III subunit delta [Clostridia bacterium]
METIKKALKDKKFDNLYFFYGQEVYLSNFYVNALKNELIKNEEFNFTRLFSDELERFQESVEAIPVFEENRMVLVSARDFSAEIKEDSYRILEEMLEDMPTYTYVVFVCSTIKKTSKIYKLLSSKCTTCVFESQKAPSLISWISNVFKKKGYEIDRDTSAYLLEFAGSDMTKLLSETEKLAAYELKTRKITPQSIEAVVTRTIDSKVFELLDAVMYKKCDQAFEILNSLMREKEEPVYINGALMRNISSLLQYKILKAEGKSVSAISEKLSLRPFVQKKYAEFEKKFSEKFLQEMIDSCAKCDIGFKTGEMDGYTGLSLLIGQMCK